MFSSIGMQMPSRAYAVDQRLQSPSTFDRLRDALAQLMSCELDDVAPGLVAFAWSTAYGAASLIFDGVLQTDDACAVSAIGYVIKVGSPRPSDRSQKNSKEE